MRSMRFPRVSVFVALALVGNAQETKWWKHAASMRTISPSCFSLGIDRLLQLVDSYAAQGVKVFSINTVYDSGSDGKEPYDTYDLWCGLAAGDPTAPNKAIGDVRDIKRLADRVHKHNMKFVSWYNPSYFWTGSHFFKQAEKDVAGCDADGEAFSGCLPADSFAHWFNWCDQSCGEVNAIPSDDKPDPPGHPGAAPVNAWVRSDVAGASYYSYWANQPTTDWLSPHWQSAFANTTRYLIETMELDGFVFDDPEGYQGTGAGSTAGTPIYWDADPQVMKQFVTDVVHRVGEELGRDIAAFAEIYSSDFDGGFDFVYDYGFDGLISNYGDQSRAFVINQAVQDFDSSGLEDAFYGPGGPDAFATRGYFQDDFEAVAWDRRVLQTSFFDGDDLGINKHDCGVGYGAAYAEKKGLMGLDACFLSCEADDSCDAVTIFWNPDGAAKPTGEREIDCYLRGGIDLSECRELPGVSTFAVHAVAAQRLALGSMLGGGILAVVDSGGDGIWWSEAPYPGSQGDEIAKSMYSAVEHNAALGKGSLRLTLDNSGDHFAMLRYDAKHEGKAALIVLNMWNERRQVTVDLSMLPKAYGQEPVDLITNTVSAPLDASYTVDMEPLGVQMLTLQLPAWDSQGKLNCYSKGHGCLDDTRCAEGVGPILLSQCLLECINDDDIACEAVTVAWLLDGWVMCHKRGPVDAGSCDQTDDGSFATFTLRSSSTAPGIVMM